MLLKHIEDRLILSQGLCVGGGMSFVAGLPVSAQYSEASRKFFRVIPGFPWILPISDWAHLDSCRVLPSSSSALQSFSVPLTAVQGIQNSFMALPIPLGLQSYL